jgi:hypothetical protein
MNDTEFAEFFGIGRPAPTNLSAEPPYPGAPDVVILSMRGPDWIIHFAHAECSEEGPHKLMTCPIANPSDK